MRQAIRGRTREPWLDNARFLAAALIVSGHLVSQTPEPGGNAVVVALASGLWAIRLPVLILVSGYFSRAEPLDGPRMVSLVRNVLLVYVVVTLLGSLLRVANGTPWSFDPGRPAFGLWFLLSLFCWRVVLPYASMVRGLPVIAVVAALSVGFFETFDDAFFIDRTIVYFPIFLLGHAIGRRGLRGTFTAPWVRPLSLAFLALTIPVMAYLPKSGYALSPRTNRMGMYAGDLGEQWQLVAERCFLLALAAASAVALLGVVPRRRLPVFTYLGSGTLYAYALHAFVLVQLRALGGLDQIDTPAKTIALYAGGLAVAMLLASPPVRWATRWLIQPRYTWPFRLVGVPPPDPAPASATTDPTRSSATTTPVEVGPWHMRL